MDIEWLLLATGVTGGWTFIYLVKWVMRLFVPPQSISLYHSPKGGCTDAILKELRKARKEILVQAYSFTSKPIAEVLVEAKKRGVHIEILLDRSNEQETYSELGFLAEHGLLPKIDAEHAIAHNKIMLIDSRTIITGSFNFTHQAEAENAENLLIIKGHGELARSYRESFQKHKAHSQASTGKAAPAPSHAAHRKAA